MMMAGIAVICLLGLMLLAGLVWLLCATTLARRSPSLSTPSAVVSAGKWSPGGQLRLDESHADWPRPATFTQLSGLNKTQAEELLDWLQGQGCSDCIVTYSESNGFTVRRR